MKIQYASDLHLEFADNSKWLAWRPLETAGDVLVLAGDCGMFGHWSYVDHPFWDWAAERYRQVVIVPGNHEFYLGRYALSGMADGWRLEIRPNVHCLYNAVVPQADDIDLIVTTLWARIEPENAAVAERGVADFHRIEAGGGRLLDAARFNAEHERCFAFLKKALAASAARHIVVATHHVPSKLLTVPEHRESPINGAFTVELRDFIETCPAEYWIYGHSHRNIDAVIGKTRCVSNQLGYVSDNEHMTFDRGKVIEIV